MVACSNHTGDDVDAVEHDTVATEEQPLVSYSWSQQAMLAPNDAPPGAEYGYSIAVDGATAVVGAYGDDALASNSGSAYAWMRSGTTWTQQAKLLPSDGAAGDDFGYSVAVEGQTAIVGAYQDDDMGDNSGSAYVFVRDTNGTWSQQAKLTANDGAAYANFGIAVAV